MSKDTAFTKSNKLATKEMSLQKKEVVAKNSKKKFNYTVFIARCQPPHLSHVEIINRALKMSDKIIILLGSANKARDIKNPFTWREREEMVRDCFSPNDQTKILVKGISDTYNDQTWVRTIQETVENVIRGDRMSTYKQDPSTLDNVVFDPKIGLIGHEKDDTSYYLKLFPQWKMIEVENIDDLNSTDIRTMMFELQQLDRNLIPEGVVDYIEAFMHSEEFIKLIEEYRFLQLYRSHFAVLKYPPVFVTTDAVVTCGGHVLLVKRRSSPGKGTWACVGGFIGQNELIEDSMIRELKEETKIKVPIPVLKGNIKHIQVFDNPNRSLRGRTITHAYLINLPPQPDGKLPQVKGSSDAAKAQWVPLTVVEKMQDQMFEDHYTLVNKMLDHIGT